MNTIFVDEAQQRRFERDGFVVARLMSAEEAAGYRRQLEAVRADGEFEPNSPGPTSAYHVSLIDPDLAYRRRARQFTREVLAERVGALLDDYRFLTGGLLIKPPGAAEIEIHRDWTMTPTPEEVALNCWCALVDIDERNGGLFLLPGSHALVPNIEAPGVAPFFSAYCERLKAHSVSVPLKAGEAVIFDYRSLHWSTANRSSELRAAVAAAFIPRRSRAVLFLPESEGGDRRFRMVEPADQEWIDPVADGLGGIPAGARTIGFVEDDNRPVPLAEFERLLLAARAGSAPRGRPAGLVARLKAWLD
jgi:phytanoyl-CoA dioxygenase PhyH